MNNKQIANWVEEIAERKELVDETNDGTKRHVDVCTFMASQAQATLEVATQLVEINKHLAKLA